MQKAVDGGAQAGQNTVLAHKIHKPQNGNFAVLAAGHRAGYQIAQQRTVFAGTPYIILQVRKSKIAPLHIPYILGRSVGAGGHAQRLQLLGVFYALQSKAARYRQHPRIRRAAQVIFALPAQAEIMGHTLRRPAQKAVKYTGFGANVVAGHHAGVQ